jgi:hypothetical protein
LSDLDGKSHLTNESFLEALKDFQETGAKTPSMSFSEWRSDIQKAQAPNAGMMGRLNTSSYAPTGPSMRPNGQRGVGFKGDGEPWFGSNQNARPSGVSQYSSERPNQPPPWIDDVDMASIWYSPMEPVWPYGPPYYNRPREWNYPVGYNINFVPQRLESMGMLRGMRQSWGILSTIIETRKDQMLRLPWTIQRRDKPRGASKTVDEIRKFFRHPDGKSTYGQWSRKVMDDLFCIDAPSLYMDRRLDGTLRHVECLDGATIFPLIDDAGRRPDTTLEMDPKSGLVYTKRQPAFQQIVYGLPMVNLSEDELIYAMMRPRPEMPIFGYSPVEQIFIEATEAIRKTFYQLEFWRSGSLPELIVTVPENWTPRQIAMFQGHFDALLSGNLTLKSKVRFLPGNMKPFEIKNADGKNLWSERDELLVRLACYAFSVSPTPFIRQMSRATAQNAQQTAQEEGLYPLMSWWKDDVMDAIIRDKLGFDDIEFVFLPRPEVDLLKQAQIHEKKLSTGEMTLNEARAENGEEPYDKGIGDVPLVYTAQGAVRLDAILSGEAVPPGQPGSTAPEPGAGSKPMSGPAKPHEASPMPQPEPKKLKPSSVSSPTAVRKVLSRREVEAASAVAVHKPTKLQTKNGNYPKGHFWLHGLNISIENAKGSKRTVKDRLGNENEVKMTRPYGYIRGTVGADGDQVDVFIGKHPKSKIVYVIDQDKFDASGNDHGFNEHKVMLGYKNLEPATKNYLETHYDGLGHERVSAVTMMTVKEFKRWLKHGDMNKPIAEQQVGTVVLRRGDGQVQKADTISGATNLNWYDQTTAVPKKKKKKKAPVSGPKWLTLVA